MVLRALPALHLLAERPARVVLVLLRPVLQRLVRPAVPLPERVRRLRVEVAVELLRR